MIWVLVQSGLPLRILLEAERIAVDLARSVRQEGLFIVHA
jgi:hypothetical protein